MLGFLYSAQFSFDDVGHICYGSSLFMFMGYLIYASSTPEFWCG